MHRKMICSLWVDSHRARYFLIPENQDIPTGYFILFNLTGAKKTVTPNALIPFEITEEEANACLENELNQLIGQIEISEYIQQEIPKMLEEIFIEKEFPKKL